MLPYGLAIGGEEGIGGYVLLGDSSRNSNSNYGEYDWWGPEAAPVRGQKK